MRTHLLCLFAVFVAGCSAEANKETGNVRSSNEVSTPDGSRRSDLAKIWSAWQECQRKNNFGPEEGGMFDKYLKVHGDPAELTKDIEIRWNTDTRRENRQYIIAYQTKSRDGQYAVLFASGRIDTLDEDELANRDIPVGRTLEQFKKRMKEGDLAQIEQYLRANETAWKQRLREFEKEEQNDDAFEKQRKTPVENPALERVRKGNLEFDLKKLAERREKRKQQLESGRREYEEQKRRLEERKRSLESESGTTP